MKKLSIKFLPLLAALLFSSQIKAAITVPYSIGFEANEDYASWKVLDVNGDNSTWTRQTTGGIKGGPCMRHSYNALNAANDWLISPKIKLETGKNYKVKFSVRSGSPVFFESMALYIASAQHPDSVIGSALWYKDTINQTVFFDVEIPVIGYAGGDYTFAFHAYSGRSKFFLYVDDFSVSELPDKDAAAVKLFGTLNPMVGKPFTYKVLVKNDGVADLSGYTVKLLDGQNRVLASNAMGSDIASCQTTIINVPWIPANTGTFSVRAVIEIPGNTNAANDTTPSMLATVNSAGDYYDGTIGIKGITGSDVLPLAFCLKSSVVQTLYLDHEIIGREGVINELKYFYYFMSPDINNKHVQIWMANTSLTKLSTWLPESEFMLVYDGTMTFPQGDNIASFILDKPFVYEGNSLVIMTKKPMDATIYAGPDMFYNTVDSFFTGRTLYYVSDYYEHDGIFPGTSTDGNPNIKLKMGFAGGSVSGTISDGINPLKDVTVEILGSTYKRITDADGKYSFDFVLPGAYKLRVSKHGYNDDTSATETITVDNNSIVDFTIKPATTYIVNGKVTGSNAADGLEGVEIRLEGYENYTAITNAAGDYSIPGVYAGYIYNIHAKLPGYVAYDSTIDLTRADSTHFIILNEYAYVALNPKAVEDGDNVIVSWDAPSISTFRYDNGICAGQMGFNDPSGGLGTFPKGVIGSVHRTGAVLNKMSWYLAAKIDSNPTNVNLFVFALTPEGLPSTDIIYSALNIPSTKLEWNSYEFPEPVEAPNGFYMAIGNSTQNLSVGLAIPDAEYPFFENTHFLSSDYSIYPFTTLDGSVKASFMIRAEGRTIGKITKSEYSGSKAISAPVSYKIYRLKEDAPESLWTLLGDVNTASGYTDEQWATLPYGVYQYAVKVMYPGNNLSRAVLTNTLPKDMEAKVTINLTTNSGDSVNSAVVTLTNQDGNPNHIYTIENAAPIFPKVWKGIYNLSVVFEGFAPHSCELDINSDTSLNIILEELIIAPYGLEIIKTAVPSNVTLSWNRYTGFFDDMESYDNFIIKNIGDYTLVDLDKSGTWGISGCSWTNSNYVGSFMVFNPYATTPALKGTDVAPHSGNKYLACFNSISVSDGGTGFNDDWLILPKMKILTGAEFRFWAKAWARQFGTEKIKVAVSTTGTNVPADFTVISSGEYVEVSGDAWQEFVYDLSNYAGQEVHLAINCVSRDIFALMIDDISVGFRQASVMSGKKSLSNYIVYLDSNEVATTSNTIYDFTELEYGKHTAGVQAVYSTGISVISTIDFTVGDAGIVINNQEVFTVYPNPVANVLNIQTDAVITEIALIDLSGKTVVLQKGGSKQMDLRALSSGHYIARIRTETGVSTVKVVKQ